MIYSIFITAIFFYIASILFWGKEAKKDGKLILLYISSTLPGFAGAGIGYILYMIINFIITSIV